MNPQLRALIYTTLFPNSTQPLHGTFILERMRHLLPFVDMSVVAPVPYFPRINVNQRWFNFAEAPHVERFAGFDVCRKPAASVETIARSRRRLNRRPLHLS